MYATIGYKYKHENVVAAFAILIKNVVLSWIEDRRSQNMECASVLHPSTCKIRSSKFIDLHERIVFHLLFQHYESNSLTIREHTTTTSLGRYTASCSTDRFQPQTTSDKARNIFSINNNKKLRRKNYTSSKQKHGWSTGKWRTYMSTEQNMQFERRGTSALCNGIDKSSKQNGFADLFYVVCRLLQGGGKKRVYETTMEFKIASPRRKTALTECMQTTSCRKYTEKCTSCELNRFW